MFDTSKIRCKTLCVALAVAVATFGALPKTGTPLDEYTQIEKAEAAIPLVAIPIAATLFSLAGVAVVGATQEQYNVNLEKCWNDFVSWSGSTSEALVSELENAVGDDGKIILSMLTTSALPNILNWGKSLDAPVVETSAVPAGDTYVYGGIEVSLPMVDDVASMYGLVYGGVSTCYGYATFTKSNGEFLEYALWSNQKSPHLKYFLQSDKIAFENIMSPAPGSATGWGTQTMTTYSGLNASYFKSIKRDSIIDFYIDNTIVGTYNRGAFSGAGTYTPLVTAVDGAVAGSFAGSVIGGGTTLDQIAPTVNVWLPTADQLANGYAYTDVMEGTGALEGTQGGEGGGETGDTDTGSLLNKILAALTLLLGLDRIPAILDGINNALTGWWDALMAWCADVWAWMQSLDMAQWLSDVWDWLRNVDLVSLLSPLALLWEWLSSLGLTGWLADVWAWIQSLGLVQWLAQVWDWIATLDLAGALAGILAAVQALPDFFKPKDDFDWSKFKDVDAYMIFPICLPWDLYDMVALLSSSAKAPAFEFPLATPVGDYSLSVDLSDYDSVASVLRTVELLLFCVGLVFVTKKMMG